MNLHTNSREKNFETALGLLLRTGVILSATIVLTGGILYLFQHGYRTPHYHTFRGEPQQLRSIKLIVSGVWQFNSLSIIQAGLLILLGTPIARIILSVFGFMIEKDLLYVMITVLVLLIIGFSLFSGFVI